MPRTKKKKKTAPRRRKAAGNLRIGSHWNAITIIARSQTHPLKAVCELVENSIDARARNVHIIRMRRKGKIMLEVSDDGQGLPLDSQGKPDFAFIATHVCDSMKRRLEEKDRKGIHGEFGIGLLSFWSLGEQIRLISADRNGRLMEMILQSGKRSFDVRHVRGELPCRGTRVVVGPLLGSTRNIVTGEKLNRYLSAELRDRIRSSGVIIRITDRVARKELTVKPRAFEGTPLKDLRMVQTPFGPLRMELYVRANSSNEGAGVAICKDGTRVIRNVAELIPFQHEPWTSGRLEGLLDYAPLTIAPGTRSGIVPDGRFDALSAAIASLEPAVAAAIHELDQAQTEQASREILRHLKRAFRNAFKELPAHEYLFFDIPSAAGTAGHAGEGTEGAEDAAGEVTMKEGVASPATSSTALEDENETEEGLILLRPGPLAMVRISPRTARAAPGTEVPLLARMYDAYRVRIDSGVVCDWHVVEGPGRLGVSAGEHTSVTADGACEVVVAVTASQGEHRAEARCRVKFIEGLGDGVETGEKGLPAYRLEPAPGEPWRSRYNATANEIVVNSGHRDYLASRQTAAKNRRYIGKLYAKEIVLLNFPHEPACQGMDRLIEILLRTEDTL